MPFRYRHDGDYVADIPPTRKIMPFIMRKRNECAVYFEQQIDIERPREFLRQFREDTGLRATMLHVYIWAIARVMAARPRLNRFTAGGRLFQRRGIWVAFSGKKAKTDDHPIVVMKRRIDPEWSFEQIVREIEGIIDEGKSDKPSSTDKELDLVFKLPAFLIMPLAWLLMKLDHWGLLPAFATEHDAMFASIFIANLGSVGLDAGHHHLYEYGNIPIFMVIGKTRPELDIDEKRQPIVRDKQTLKYTFDERIEDGLYCAQSLELFKAIMEDPEKHGIA